MELTVRNGGMNRTQCKDVFWLAMVCLWVYMSSPGLVNGASTPTPVMVFAAASTTNAVTEIAKLFSDKHEIRVTPSFASSSTLAKQIQNGAPAAVYISANKKWMDFLEEKQQIEPASRFDLLSNRIVLIAPVDQAITFDLVPGGGDPAGHLIGYLGGHRLAMGDPAHVPAGIYGQQALETLGIWDRIENKIARAKDVRSALMLVARREAPLGLVYATDAAISKRVRVVGTFPLDSHPPIVYPVALVSGNSTPAAQAFVDFLKTSEAKTVFEKYGFTVR